MLDSQYRFLTVANLRDNNINLLCDCCVVTYLDHVR